MDGGRPSTMRLPPMGPGLRAIRLRMPLHDVVVLGGILAGYDGLASVHGDDSGVVVLLATDGTVTELEEIVSDLASALSIERLD